MLHTKISVVTPTLGRPKEVKDLLQNLAQQTILPFEIILVDGAANDVVDTSEVVTSVKDNLPYHCHYFRYGGGTAIQRNVGIDNVQGDFVAFIDDDIRLESDFFEVMLSIFDEDTTLQIGGIAGYITNQHLDPNTSPRWRWNRRLKLYSTYEPGRFDYRTGYPINRYLQPPHDKVREIDFMGAGCAIWRKEVFAGGLRFSEFFSGFGILEDAHLALRAGKAWRLLEAGKAKCIHLRSQSSRENKRKVARKTATNYRFVFVDIVPNRTFQQEFRFWLIQIYDLCRLIIAAFRGESDGWKSVLGKIEGIFEAAKI